MEEQSLALRALLVVPNALLSVLAVIVRVVSWSGIISFQLTFTKIFLLVAFSLFAFSIYLKAKFLNRYTKLKENPLPKTEGFDLNPEIAKQQGAGLSSYLDDFLSAIRVFGYLERSVFVELSRHLMTRRLAAGDTINLSEDSSFYIVIEGSVQVFAQTQGNHGRRLSGTYEEEDDNGFQLLNVVNAGGTLSSLFTILRLFTSGISLRYDEPVTPQADDDDVQPLTLDTHRTPSRTKRAGSVGSALRHSMSFDSDSTEATAAPDQPQEIDPLTTDRSKNNSTSHSPTPVVPHEAQIARALTDTTLAVLPAEAFRRLTTRFTRASAHIVQVILTRLQRVTFATAHEHLSLTKEVVRTEKAINELACYPLPASFYESGGMNRLRQRFVPDTRPDPEKEAPRDYFGYDPPSPLYGPQLGRRASSRRAPEMPAGVRMRLKSQPPTPAALDSQRSRSRLSLNLGMTPAVENPPDLLDDLDEADESTKSTPERSFSFTHAHDSDLKDLCMDSISRAIGLVQPEPKSGANSLETSPAFGPVSTNGANRLGQRAALNSSFGAFNLLSPADDGESITTASSSAHVPLELENEVEILAFSRDTVLVHAGERNAGLFFVIDGHLDVMTPTKATNAGSMSAAENASPKPLFSVKPGGIAGYLVAKTDVFVGFLSSKALERIMDRRPNVLLTLAKRLMGLLSPLLLHVDSALEWQHVEAGTIIYRSGTMADSYYIVIQGRLRAINEKRSGGVEIISEYGQNDSVGELECITGERRTATVHAIRDTELVRIPMALFNAIAARHPGITLQMTRAIANRVRSENSGGLKSTGSITTNEHTRNSNLNLKTIAIIPVSHSVPVSEFADRLRTTLEQIGAPTSYLNQATVVSVMGRHAFSPMGKLKLAGWLAETEQRYRTVLYVADAPVSAPWTSTCIRQADCVLLVADAGADPELGEYERLLVGMKTTARKELVLLHSDRIIPSGLTRSWLQLRPFIQAHHHLVLASASGLGSSVKVPSAVSRKSPAPVVKLKQLREVFISRLDQYRHRSLRAMPPQPEQAPHIGDFARLARRLCGHSFGLVLGGGGARGIAHIGALRAMRERGVPIDLIGGCSMGAFVGGLYAREGDLVSTYGRAKRFAGRMSSLLRILSDVTWPIVSWTTGHEFNRGIYKSFGDYHLEDFTIRFFCNTTNLSWSRMEVHESGFAWRFIRASMSLAGLLPPLCDRGDMLCDGGYIDCLPVATMLAQGVSNVIAVDVSAVDDTSPLQFGESLSGWWILIQRFNPWSNARSIPTLTEIQSRLAYMSSVPALEEVKNTPGVLYLRMPVTSFGTMQFQKFVEIEEVGYQAMRSALDDWTARGLLPSATLDPKATIDSAGPKARRTRRASI